MRLVVVSHTPHHRDGDHIVGWGGTVRELDHLAGLVDELVHVAPLHPDPAPAEARPYTAANVRLVPVTPSGADGLAGKVSVLRCVPGYWRVIAKELATADAVHVRCPANVALVGLAVLATRRQPSIRWYKYAGDWSGGRMEPLSYCLQRLWLRRCRLAHRGVVTVNGTWDRQPPHVLSFDNPCLTDLERQAAARTAHDRRLSSPVRLLFAGRLGGGKRPELALRTLDDLVRSGIDASLHLVGDGEQRSALEHETTALGLRDRVTFDGWLPRRDLDERYADAHLLLVPSRTEGFPKVIAEALAFGTVPVVANLPAAAQMLSKEGCGSVVPQPDPVAWSAAVRRYTNDPSGWKHESQQAVDLARRFTYETYVGRVRSLISVPGLEEQAPDG